MERLSQTLKTAVVVVMTATGAHADTDAPYTIEDYLTLQAGVLAVDDHCDEFSAGTDAVEVTSRPFDVSELMAKERDAIPAMKNEAIDWIASVGCVKAAESLSELAASLAELAGQNRYPLWVE